MIKITRTSLILILSGWLFAGLCFATDTLVEREGYTLTQLDINNMLAAGEHIAAQAFTPQEKQQLRAWALELFRRDKKIKDVAFAFDKYAAYLKQANSFSDPAMRQMVWHHFYREMVFRWRFPRYHKQQQTLLDVIQKYNPVKIRLDKEKMLLAAKDPVLAEKNGYFISQPMLTALQTVAEFLARKTISAEHRKGLADWAVADFNNAPQQASVAYASFFDEVVPQAIGPLNRHQQERFRARTYRNYYFAFKADKVAQQWATDLMDVVTHYNPTLIVDETNHLLISESELDDSVATARYFSDQLQLNMDLSEQFRQVQRQQLIARFIARKDPKRSIIDSGYMLRSQLFWAQLPPSERQALAPLIRESWQSKDNIWLALQPLLTKLDAVIQAENQQQLIEQQIMAGLLIRQLQLNQQLFNRTMQTYREHADHIGKSMRELSTIQSLQITGNKVLEKHDSHFLIEDQRGYKYSISR